MDFRILQCNALGLFTCSNTLFFTLDFAFCLSVHANEAHDNTPAILTFSRTNKNNKANF